MEFNASHNRYAYSPADISIFASRRACAAGDTGAKLLLLGKRILPAVRK